MEHFELVVMEASSMSEGARIALFALAALLVLILACVVFFGVALRKREPDSTVESEPESEHLRDLLEPGCETVDEPAELALDSGAVLHSFGGGGAGLEVAKNDNMACPTCRREFDQGLAYCPYDARGLVLVSELRDPARKDGSCCPSCKRSYDSGVRFCPHDASELIPIAVYRATARSPERKPSGVLARICPQCQRRFDLSASFCAKDGSELVVLH